MTGASRLPMDCDLHATVRAIMNSADPIGLLAIGAPDDEYEPEIRDLAGRLASVPRKTLCEPCLSTGSATTPT